MNSNKIIIYFVLLTIFLSGTITMVVYAAPNTAPMMLFCANNPISDKYNVNGITAGNIIGGCKEKLDGYSWGSRIYILIYAPGWNTDSDKLDVIGNNKHNPITANSREGNMSLEGDGCNGFIETAPDHGLFYGSIKLSGFKHDINGDGRPDLFGGNRCEKNNSVLDDGAGRVEAKQNGAVTVNFEYSEKKFVSKTALHSWREATLEFDKTEYDVSDEIHLTLTDLDNMRWPFDKKQPYEIHIYSDSDSAGILMDAYWVPNYKGIVQMNGHYPIKLNLTFDDESYESSAPFGFSSGLLRVSPGDTIYAKYSDYSLPKPYSTDEQKIIVATTKVNDLAFDVTIPLEVSSEITDSSGKPLHHCIKGENVKIKINVSNTRDEPVSAYVITQIKDFNDVTQHVSVSTINIAPGKISNINSEWIMKNDGEHTFEIFVWDSLWNLNPISEPLILVI